MRDIREMEPGDFVKIGHGRYEEIAKIEGGVTPNGPLPRSWTIKTKSGLTVSMWQARAYFKKDDPRP